MPRLVVRSAPAADVEQIRRGATSDPIAGLPGYNPAARSEPEALAPLLALLERDIAARPEALVPLTPELAARMMAATKGVAGERSRRTDRG